MFNKKGFTLIELLIVIGIIAILAAALIVGLNPAERFKQARNATRWSHLNTISSTIMAYVVDEQGDYPPCIPIVEEDLVDDDYETLFAGGEEDGEDWGVNVNVCGDLDITADDPSDGAFYKVGWISDGGTPSEPTNKLLIWSTAQEAIDEEVWIVQ